MEKGKDGKMEITRGYVDDIDPTDKKEKTCIRLNAVEAKKAQPRDFEIAVVIYVNKYTGARGDYEEGVAYYDCKLFTSKLSDEPFEPIPEAFR